MNVMHIFSLLNLLFVLVAYAYLSTKIVRTQKKILNHFKSQVEAIQGLYELHLMRSIKDKIIIREQMIKEEQYEQANMVSEMINKDMVIISDIIEKHQK